MDIMKEAEEILKKKNPPKCKFTDIHCTVMEPTCTEPCMHAVAHMPVPPGKEHPNGAMEPFKFSVCHLDNEYCLNHKHCFKCWKMGGQL
jgi:hypothetical protein